MADLFEDKAEGWDERPVPQQISQGVFAAIEANVPLSPDLAVLDFGAGTSSRLRAFLSAWWPRIKPGGLLLVHSTLTNQVGPA